MTDRPWKIPLSPSRDQQHVADFLGLDNAPAPRRPRQPHEVDPLGDQAVVSKIPELNILYAVQKDLLKLFDALGDLEDEIDHLEDSGKADDHARRIRRQAEFAYRSMRTWLNGHG